jgi:mRNA interferase MazF
MRGFTNSGSGRQEVLVPSPDPFAVRLIGPKGVASHFLGHQPKSFDWRARNAKPHPLRKVPEESYARACETLNPIMEIEV